MTAYFVNTKTICENMFFRLRLLHFASKNYGGYFTGIKDLAAHTYINYIQQRMC